MSGLENAAVKMPGLLKELHEYATPRRQCLTLKVQEAGAPDLKFTAVQRQGVKDVEVVDDYGPCEDLPSLAFFVDAFESLVVHARSSLGIPPSCDTVRFVFDEDERKYVMWDRLGDGTRQVLLSQRDDSIDFLAAPPAPFQATRIIKRDDTGHIRVQEKVDDDAPNLRARAIMIKFWKLFVLNCQSAHAGWGTLHFSENLRANRQPRRDLHPAAVYLPGFSTRTLGTFRAELCSAVRLVAPPVSGSNAQVFSKMRMLSSTANAHFDPADSFRSLPSERRGS